MAENEGTTKVGAEHHETAEGESSEELLSLDSLDSILVQEDPDFAKSLEAIGPDEPGHEIYEASVELEYKIEDEIKLWNESSPRRKRLAKLFPFLPRISYRVKLRRMAFRLSVKKFKEQVRYRVLNAGPLLLTWFKFQTVKTKVAVGETLGTFKAFNTVKKLLFVALIAATGVAGFLIYRIATNKFLPPSSELFMGSIEELAQKKYSYTAEDQKESFYESTRTAQNIIEVKKLVANIRRSATSGPNPMGAFEFYVEGTANDVVVEVKDREVEVTDLFLRTIEDMTYDQLASGEGKQQLNERLRKEVNKILTKGKIRRVFIKSAIVKP